MQNHEKVYQASSAYVLNPVDQKEQHSRKDPMRDRAFGELMALVRAGDQDAAAELVRRHESAVRRFVRFRLTHPRMRSLFDSMDICQSVLASFFFRAAAGQYDVESPDKLVQLLARMARNKLASHARKERTARYDDRKPEDLIDHAAGLRSREPEPGEEISARELCQKALGQLTDEERELVERRREGCDWASIAQEKGSTAIVVRKQFSRALDRVLKEVGLE
jgi:RNA polymerase sigma-70 factor (ECF subfamily)